MYFFFLNMGLKRIHPHPLTWTGFWSVSRWMISSVCFTMRLAIT